MNLHPYQRRVFALFCALIAIGGLGFFVWEDILRALDLKQGVRLV